MKGSGKGETILIVDDEAELVALAESYLGWMGYRTIAAAEAEAALKALDEEPDIDLVFSDIVMPGRIDGLSLAETATARRPGLKVLLTSGHASKLCTGLPDTPLPWTVIAKPYALSEVVRQIRKLLDDGEDG